MKKRIGSVLLIIFVLLTAFISVSSATSSGEVTFNTCQFASIADFNTADVTLGNAFAQRGTVSFAQYSESIRAIKLSFTAENNYWVSNFTESFIPSVQSTYQTLSDDNSTGLYFYVHNDTGLSLKLYPDVLNGSENVARISLVQNADCYLISDDKLTFSKIVHADSDGIKVPADFRGYIVIPFASMGKAEQNAATTDIFHDNVLSEISAGKFGLFVRTLNDVSPATGRGFYVFNYGSYKPNSPANNFYSFVNFNQVNWKTGQFSSWPYMPATHGYMEAVDYNGNKALRLTFGTYVGKKQCQFADIDAFASAFGDNTIGQASPNDKTGIYIKVHNNTSKNMNYFTKFLVHNSWYTNTVGSNLLLIAEADLANPIKATVQSGTGITIPANFLGYIVIPYQAIANNELNLSSLPVSGDTTDSIYQSSFGANFQAGNVTFNAGEYFYILDYGAYKPTPSGPTALNYNDSRPQLGSTPTLNKSQAQQVAANILAAPKPAIGDTVLASLSLPTGFSASIYVADYPNILSSNGTITPPDNFTLAKVVYEITKQGETEKGYTSPLNVLIPARKRIIDSNDKNTLSNLRYGLMITWGANNNTVDMGVGIVGPNGEDLGGISNYTNIQNLTPIVDDLSAMNFEYVCITDFHGLGLTIHPSAALDYYRGEGVFTAKHDLLGELITALKNKGIKVMLLTHPLDGHDYSIEDRTALGWYDSANNYGRWNNFIDDVYADIISRYGSDLVGVAFDSEFGLSGNAEWAGKLNIIKLRDTIRSYSNMPLLSLVPSNQLSNYSLKEIWRPSWFDPWMSRSEDVYNTEDWPAYYRAPAVVTTNHWATVSARQNSVMHLNAIQLYRYMALQACVSTDGPGVMWGTSPYYNGQWELGVREAFLDVGARISLLKESLQGVVPSKSYVRREGAKLSALPNGIAATSSADGKYEYIHIFNPPTGNVLNLPVPTDSKQFDLAFCLNTNKPITLLQNENGVTLTLQSTETWDTVDTVIRLTNTAASSTNLALFKPVLYSSSVESTNLTNVGWGNIRVVDGNTSFVPQTENWSFPLYGWSSAGKSTQLSSGESEWVTIDLKDNYSINNVILYPRSDAGNENLGFPTNFLIKTSTDNVNFTTVSTQANYPKPNGSAIFFFGSVNARYVKVEATALTRVPLSSGNYFFQLGEIEVYSNANLVNATGVKLNKADITISVNDTYALMATVFPESAENKNVIWASNDTNIATVSDNGVVTAKAVGTVNITVTTEDGGFVARCAVEVTPNTKELFLSSIQSNDDTQNWEFKGVAGNGSWFYIRNISSNLYLTYIGGQYIMSAYTGGGEQYWGCDKLGASKSLVTLFNQVGGLANSNGQLVISAAYPSVTFSNSFKNFLKLNTVNYGNEPNGTVLYTGTLSFKDDMIYYYLTCGKKPSVDFGKHIVSGTQISNIQPNSSAGDFLIGVNLRSDTDIVFHFLSENNKIGTGTTMELKVNGVTSSTYTAVIYGDVDGDGDIAIGDLATIKKHLLKSQILTGAKLAAADILKKGTVSISDLLAVKKKLLGLATIGQK